jgi:hypothetical protein
MVTIDILESVHGPCSIEDGIITLEDGTALDLCALARSYHNSVGCLMDVLDADGDLDSMSFDRYREVLQTALGDEGYADWADRGYNDIDPSQLHGV